MGYMFATAPCFGCSKLFSFNPDLVPSIPVDGVRQPICQDCVNLCNPRRIANGLAPIQVREGAYEPQEV